MKCFALSILLLFVATTALGQDYFAPRFGGGYYIYDSGDYSGVAIPRFGGGMYYHGSDGSWGYSTPRFGGGYYYYGNRPRHQGGWDFYGR